MLNARDDIEDLRKQLHFYGSISSSNTRGGSEIVTELSGGVYTLDINQ